MRSSLTEERDSETRGSSVPSSSVAPEDLVRIGSGEQMHPPGACIPPLGRAETACTSWRMVGGGRVQGESWWTRQAISAELGGLAAVAFCCNGGGNEHKRWTSHCAPGLRPLSLSPAAGWLWQIGSTGAPADWCSVRAKSPSPPGSRGARTAAAARQRASCFTRASLCYLRASEACAGVGRRRCVSHASLRLRGCFGDSRLRRRQRRRWHLHRLHFTPCSIRGKYCTWTSSEPCAGSGGRYRCPSDKVPQPRWIPDTASIHLYRQSRTPPSHCLPPARCATQTMHRLHRPRARACGHFPMSVPTRVRDPEADGPSCFPRRSLLGRLRKDCLAFSRWSIAVS